jgi:phosphoenolpyruvate-protein kinase (PTS system EI component)
MTPPAIPRAKQIVRALDYAESQRAAQVALELETPQAVRHYIEKSMPIA